ncbi:MAG: hypothetical protein LLG08_01055 [Actinomycetia bacterium]|nr:hypothetical protein [Actinomycetes bacterium]
MIDVARIKIGSGGLPSCDRCHAAETPAYRPAAEVIAEIERLSEAQLGAIVMLAGAEAFMHPELPALIGAAVSSGAQRVGLQTAGALLSVGGNTPGALHAGVRHFEITFLPGDEAASAGEHDRQLEGVRDLFEAAGRARVKVAISARVHICRHTVSRLPEAVADLVAAGVGAVHIATAWSAGMGPSALSSVTAACDTGVVNAVWVDVVGVALPSGHAMHELSTVRT